MLAAPQTGQPRPGPTKVVRCTTEYTVEQLYRTLRLCLRYMADGSEIFNRVINGLGNIYFIPMLSHLSKAELHRLIPMLSQKLKCLRLQVSDIPKLQAICRQLDVHLVNTRYCALLTERDSKNTEVKHIELLGEVLPNLEILHVSCPIQGHFPVLGKVHTLHLNNVSQATLADLLQKCPQLEHLELRNSTCVYDVQKIGLCKLIKDLQLPLEITAPLAIAHLTNLRHLSLQCKRLWPESAWLPTVLTIILAKRFALERLTIDGTWLVGPLILSKLQLTHCTALKELSLSNCKVIDSGRNPLPLICQQLSFRKCHLNMLHGFVVTQQMLSHLNLFDCQVQWNGHLLRHLLDLSKRRLGPPPLHLHFSQSTRLRSEYTKWVTEELEASKPWLQVKEVEPATWKHPLGMITMEFGRPINFLPNLQRPLESIPVAADLLKDFDSYLKD
ncbi:uncharacterized protein LOC110187855 [Drosophila serrata]|uniref:uncharacterized protein LOC110187855 n=1 Tax=Drosophila serrata TaxID=7274 RepID=UPI000A1D27AD|nr:uncharacterized protein LOC110187855 [Drosophila serrata]